MKQRDIESTEMEDLEVISPGSQPVLTQYSLIGMLPTSFAFLVCDASAQSSQDGPAGEYYWNGSFNQAREERERLLKKVDVYNILMEKPERTLISKKVVMKASTRCVVVLERDVTYLERKKSLLMKKYEESLSFSSRTKSNG